MTDKIEEIKEKINTNNEQKLYIKVVANSKKNSIEFPTDSDYIKIKISKPATEGKANKELIQYLSDVLDIPKSRISIVSGEKSSLKCLLIK